jgi:hypothetical protein
MIRARTHVHLNAVIFGGLADRHHPMVHQSWWRTIEETKKWAKEFVDGHAHTKIVCANISSVLCPHEIITRPFVFIKTDADPRSWLSPYKLTQYLTRQLGNLPDGFSEIEHFLWKSGFDVSELF